MQLPIPKPNPSGGGGCSALAIHHEMSTLFILHETKIITATGKVWNILGWFDAVESKAEAAERPAPPGGLDAAAGTPLAGRPACGTAAGTFYLLILPG